MVGGALLVLMQLYLAIPLAPVVGDAFGRDSTIAFAVLSTAYSLAHGVGFVVWGPISDCYGRKVVLIPGMVALAVATAGLAVAPTLEVIVTLRAVQGFAAASFAPVALAYVGEALPPRWRTTGIGAVSTAFLVAGIVGQVYGQVVALTLGWRWAFALAAAAFVLMAPAMATILREPRRSGPPAKLAQLFRQLAGLTVRRELLLLYAAAFTLLLAFVAMYAALGPLLQTGFDLGSTDVLLVRLIGLSGMVLAPLGGTLVGRFGPMRIAVTGFTLAAVGLGLEALTVGTLWVLVAASVIFVAGVAITAPALIALVSARAGQARASGIGLYGLALFGGASIGPLAVGLPLGFTGLLLALAALLIVGAVLVTASSPSRERERSRSVAGKESSYNAPAAVLQPADKNKNVSL